MIDVNLHTVKEETKIILITNNLYSKNLTINLVKKWREEKTNVVLQVIDLYDDSICSFIDLNTIKRKTNENRIYEIIDNYNVLSYPAVLIFKRNQLIESIFGSYDNILEILDIYF